MDPYTVLLAVGLALVTWALLELAARTKRPPRQLPGCHCGGGPHRPTCPFYIDDTDQAGA